MNLSLEMIVHIINFVLFNECGFNNEAMYYKCHSIYNINEKHFIVIIVILLDI